MFSVSPQFIFWWHFACTKHFMLSLLLSRAHTHFTIHKFIAKEWKQSWHKVDLLSCSHFHCRLHTQTHALMPDKKMHWRQVHQFFIKQFSSAGQKETVRSRWLSFILLHFFFVFLSFSIVRENFMRSSINVNSNLMKSLSHTLTQNYNIKWMNSFCGCISNK